MVECTWFVCTLSCTRFAILRYQKPEPFRRFSQRLVEYIYNCFHRHNWDGFFWHRFVITGILKYAWVLIWFMANVLLWKTNTIIFTANHKNSSILKPFIYEWSKKDAIQKSKHTWAIYRTFRTFYCKLSAWLFGKVSNRITIKNGPSSINRVLHLRVLKCTVFFCL